MNAKALAGMGFIAAGMLVLTVWTWWQSANVPLILNEAPPAGQLPYLFSKLAGLLAVLLLWCQAMLGIVVPPTSARQTLILHKWGAGLFVMSICVHYALFIWAVSERQGHFPSGLLGPQFGNYFKVSVTVGWMALVGLCLVMLSALARKYLKGVWKYLHRASFVFVGLALLHAFMIGSEVTTGAYAWWFWGMVGTLCVAIVERFGPAWVQASKALQARS